MTREITRNLIINKLQKRGYIAIANDVIKNGVVLNGINICNESNFTPVIYLNNLLMRFNNTDDIVENIINIYETNKTIDINILQLTNHDWILDHLFIALQKESDEKLIKQSCEFDGIEQYLYIRDSFGEEGWSAKLNSSIMDIANLSITEVWEAASKNTFADNETVITSMASVISEIIGYSNPSEMDSDITNMYVISNRSKIKGSSAILDKEKIRNYFSNPVKKCHKLIVLPSSIHECILIPVNDEAIDLDIFNSMVQEVNCTEVDEIEQLGSHCYILSI